ncbi:MAG: 1-(5-phosphoribosyl)-5-[(5-phosphoribosylamino)methylideneamino]imidazole-4-carboxamide isomerase [Solirubrobacteraceae bacterium]
MILLPAVDILDGKAVRLARGDFGAKTVYDADPLQAARRWVGAGARALHIVDLDGARSGTPANLDHVARIAGRLDIPLQLGGGLRTLAAVREALEAGAASVVLGTAAYRDDDFLDAAVARFGDRVVVSVDVRDGRLATAGWTEQTEISDETVIERLGQRGVGRFVYSSIERDGMLSGPDLEAARRIGGVVRGSFVYSGGIARAEDLRALAALGVESLTGVIVGKALYEERFTVEEAQRALDGVVPRDHAEGD